MTTLPCIAGVRGTIELVYIETEDPENQSGIFKSLEKYLTSNPDACSVRYTQEPTELYCGFTLDLESKTGDDE